MTPDEGGVSGPVASDEGSAIRPQTRAFQRFFYATSFIVLTAVIPLYLFTERTDVAFAWTIKPGLTAAFLGAGYLAACPLEFMSGRERWWSRARLGFTAVLIFTTLTLVATLFHLDKFHFHDSHALGRSSAWAWLALYVFTPMIMVALLIPQRRVPGRDAPINIPMPVWAKAWLAVEALLFIPAGVALFVAPAHASWWPWMLTPLTAQAVGAWVISIGFVSAQAAYEGEVDQPPAVAALLVLGGAQLIAVARYHGDIDWGRPSAWIYLASLVYLVLTGGLATWLIRRARASRAAAGSVGAP